MPRIGRFAVLVLAGFTVSVSGCREILKPEASNYAIINIETLATTGATYGARPTGLFFNAAGVFLSSSIVGRDSCIIQAYPPNVTTPALDYLDVGTGVVVRFERPETEGTLTPRTQSGVTSYGLPAGESIPFVPGDTVTVEIPVSAAILEPITLSARTAEAFTPSAVTLPTNNQSDLNVTWTPAATAIPGSAMFYSLRYAAPSTTTLNREIACFFIDDGSAAIPFEALFDFRESTVRSGDATRLRIVANRIGNTVTHLTSTFTADVTINPTP